MSLLTPLYLLGALAIVAPILFHLIRRTPRGEVPFSSLMFLAPTPPKLTRRSRLDNLLLLLLRATALSLLALAFARPFLREAASLTSGDGLRSRSVVLIDTSASMRRGDLWVRAKALAARVIAEARPDDQLAIFAFDSSARPVLTFEESATLDPSKRLAVANARLDALAPTWAATDLGRAVVEAVAAVEGVADASEKAGRMPRRVVLVSDLQRGSRIDALGDFQWPSDVLLDLQTVADPGPNASLHRLAETSETGPTAPDGPVRVRVANEPGSGREAFTLAWIDAKGTETTKAGDVYVPPGESRVAVVPRPVGPVRGLRLRGDASPFDNTVALAATRKEESTVVYIGTDSPEDANGLLYYLGRVFEETPRRAVRVVTQAPSALPTEEPNRPPGLVVLAAEVGAESADRLKAYATQGGTILFVATSAGKLATLGALAGVAPPDAIDAGGRRDLMLGEIAFDHPLFAPLAGAQFSDFTKVRFWKHRKLDPKALGEVRVLARFEDGDPAVIEKPVGKGRLLVFTSGWAPADGQLARSSKFVPLMAAMLDGRAANGPEAASYLVGDRVPIAPGESGQPRLVRKPDGSEVALRDDAVAFDATDQPGVYAIAAKAGAGEQAFAVDLDPAESRTAPMAVETLEQLGCRLASKATGSEAADRDRVRQMQNGELEGRQKLWRWLILGAIGILIVETWLAGRRTRPRAARAEVLAT